jgi:phenylalanyl-tRNA synthetase beta chain
MTISYNWLCEYLPKKIQPEQLSKILTSIGLEVESLSRYEELPGGLAGLLIGQVTGWSRHPNADKLSLTLVDIGTGEPLQIVCGAPNVALGQKVVVAPIGATIHPFNGEPVTMKKVKIRGVESMGMICAPDEIGLNDDHSGILVLAGDAQPGTTAAEYFKPYEDYRFEIGLTPNRMDAMSHIGVARDVSAWLSYHEKTADHAGSPLTGEFQADNQSLQMEISIEDQEACQRYAGVSIKGVTVTDSPAWLQQRLKSIGLRPINNIVDITNFILHETGQPLHAFDADRITGQKIIVKTMAEGTAFTTLDGKERKLSADDLLICNAEQPMCIAGVYGGIDSGVTASSTSIFLESAWFNPLAIRKTSLRHGLRTDAATRFEKGVDISNTVNVLKRAANLVKSIAGGAIASGIIDVYPVPKQKTRVSLTWAYLQKLSGKNYGAETVATILTALGFELAEQDINGITVTVPFNKTDISIPADIVEEIMRIDGLDNVGIPEAITIAPAVEQNSYAAALKEKMAASLAGMGFNEIFTNSITNSAYYSEARLAGTVKMINSLSSGLNVMRPAMMETGLETVAYNCNRRNNDLRLFEFGKTYSTPGIGQYLEQQHLSLYVTGYTHEEGWKGKAARVDFYYAKGLLEKLLFLSGLGPTGYARTDADNLSGSLVALAGTQPVATIGAVNKATLDRFDIRQPVYYIDIDFDQLVALGQAKGIAFREIPKFPSATRDLSMVVDKGLRYEAIERCTRAAGITRLQSLNLFDVFETEKLGNDKKSMAISFTFLDEEKTMTDKEIDGMMARIINAYEKELNAEIRK